MLNFFHYRTSKEYSQGARCFVEAAKRNIRNVEKLLCPCLDCRNLSRQHDDIIVEHLIIRGMDPKYKSSTKWYHHGE